jgi:dTDP-4-dehydrorhamnose reductase
MRVLITGSTGLVAKGFFETASENADVLGIHLGDYAVENPLGRHQILDVRDEGALETLFSQGGAFDCVVHAAGLASVDYVEENPEEGYRSNLIGTQNVARCCRRHGAYMVYISTNAVFDGKRAPYREGDRTAPVHHYGRIKLACEQAAQEEGRDVCVVRPILMYGWTYAASRPTPVTWIYHKLSNGENIRLVDDIYENPLYNIQCGRALWAVLRKRPTGIFHFAGADRVNRYQLGIEVASAFGLDASLIEAVKSSYFPSIAPRPPDTSFITDRMEQEIEIKAMSLADGLDHMKAAL